MKNWHADDDIGLWCIKKYHYTGNNASEILQDLEEILIN